MNWPDSYGYIARYYVAKINQSINRYNYSSN